MMITLLLQQAWGLPLLEVIPANVGDWEARRSIKLSHASREDAQALNSPILIAALVQHVEAQADAEEGASLLHRGVLVPLRGMLAVEQNGHLASQ